MSGRPDSPLEAALRAHGIVHPQITNTASANTGLSLASACAMLEMETAGGNNEFGSDPGNPVHGGWVNEDRYKLMRHYVAEGYPSQGVGPCQLTSVGLLNEADARGGSWQVEPNMIIGFTFLRQLQAEFGEQGGFQHYNGSGPAAVAYGQRSMALREQWQQLINSVQKAKLEEPAPVPLDEAVPEPVPFDQAAEPLPAGSEPVEPGPVQ